MYWDARNYDALVRYFRLVHFKEYFQDKSDDLFILISLHIDFDYPFLIKNMFIIV